MTSVDAGTAAPHLYFSERLWNNLSVLREAPLTVVEAPMGYGKTVSVREYLRRNRIPYVWAPVLGGDPGIFWRDLCRALRRAAPNAEEGIAALERLGYPRDPVYAEAARELIQELDLAPGTILAVDDYHLLRDPWRDGGAAMGGLCELLARQEPCGPRMALLTRDVYVGGREALRLKGRLALVDREAFALTWSEVRDYFRQSGVTLGFGEARQLQIATGGWISALCLSMLHYRNRGDIAFSSAIATLVEEEVYSPLSQAAKDLLLALHPLERFTARQAEFLRPEPETRELLDELRSKNSFLHYDEFGESYVLHSIVKRFLAGQFDRLPEARRRAIHRNCAEWFAAEGDLPLAIAAFHAAGDCERALELLESDLASNLVTERAGFFVDLFKSCPPGLLEKHPPAMFKFALAAFSAGDHQAFGAQLAGLGKWCDGLPRGDRDADAWRGELELLRSFTVYNDIAAMSRHHRRANALMGRPTKLFSPASPWTLGSPSVLFMFHREVGGLAEEIRLMHECLPHYHTLAAGHGAGGEHLLEAEALYHAGDFDRAAVATGRALAVSSAKNQLGNILCAMFLQIRLALADGDYTLAQGTVKGMRSLIRERRDYFLLHTVDLCEGYLHAAVGRPAAVPEWIRLGGGGEKRLYTFAGGWYYLVRGRSMLLDGRSAEAVGLFAWLRESKAFAKHVLLDVYAFMYAAAALGELHRPVEAAEALGQAIEAAVPDNILMPFVENWDYLEPLEPFVSGTAAKTALPRIRALAAPWEKRRRGILARHLPPALLPMTKRELEMARLSAAGKKYKEIAADLYVAPTTVKKAFVTIYQKLGISSREELREYLERH